MLISDGSWTFQIVSIRSANHGPDAAFDDLVQLNDDMHLIHTIRGRATLVSDSAEYESHPGNVVSVPFLELHHWRKEAGREWLAINLHVRVYGAGGAALHEQPILPVVFEPAGLTGVHAHLKKWRTAWPAAAGPKQVRMAGEALAVVGRYLAEHGRWRELTQPVDPLMQGMRQAVESSPPGEVDVHTLAQQAGLSVSQFNRRFRAATGISVKALAQRHRLSLAQNLLRDTTLSVSQVSQSLGFTDIYYFSR